MREREKKQPDIKTLRCRTIISHVEKEMYIHFFFNYPQVPLFLTLECPDLFDVNTNKYTEIWEVHAHIFIQNYFGSQ